MQNIDQEFIGFFSRLLRSIGLDDLSSKIVAILYIEDREISMEEIAKMTGYSLASISNKMKLLETLVMIQRIKRPGTKRAFFYMEKDIIKLNIMRISAVKENFINPIKLNFPGFIEKYKKNASYNREARKKLTIIENYHKQVIQLEKVLDKFKRELEKISINDRI
ncbi:MAG TPA: hypothetical protein EYP86_01655 [Candidatus Altiarchaeales archaeon]|nr:hypothetical protein [Candidatus Altiarchaeales archaeon]